MITRKLNAAKFTGQSTYAGGKIIKLPNLRTAEDEKFKVKPAVKKSNRKLAAREDKT